MTNLYSVTYNTNGSTGGAIPAAQTAESNNETYTFTASAPSDLVRTGYGFIGWAENPNTTIPTYIPGATITLSSSNPSKTLYAVWTSPDTPAQSWNELYFMQQMNATACTGGNDFGKQLVDARDNQAYWVAKLKDGNCWMTQNLAIDLTGKTLTSADSDVSSNWSPTSAWGTANNTIAWQISTTGSEHGSYGGYYTWQAATAGTAPANTGEASSSICPKGWKLPTNGNTTTNKSYSKLTNGLNWTTIQAAPYYFVPSGYVNNGSLSSAGSYGYYWSSTAQSASNAYVLYFGSSNVNPSNYGSRFYGFSVRCVAR